METKNRKKKNYDTVLYMRLDKVDKDKCVEIAKHYGFPNVSTYFRELIKIAIDNYENKEVK